MKTTFIYALIDPRNDQVRYIGKSDYPRMRFNCHVADKLFVERGNNHKVNWINSLKKENLKPELFILDEVNQSEWQFWEQYYLSLYKSFGFKLVNLTKGGDGSNGMSLKNKTKKKISEKAKLQWQSGRGWKKRSKGYKVKRSNCICCGREFALNTLKQYHNEKCKFKKAA